MCEHFGTRAKLFTSQRLFRNVKDTNETGILCCIFGVFTMKGFTVEDTNGTGIGHYNERFQCIALVLAKIR